MTPDEIRAIVRATQDPQKLFGTGSADKLHRALLKICHPDLGGDGETFRALQGLWENFDSSAPEPLLRLDDICSSLEENGFFEVKTLLNNDDSDLLENEAQNLEVITDGLALYPLFSQHFPILEWLDDDSEKLSYPNDLHPSDLVTLDELVKFYGASLDVRHLGWIWRRMVAVLGFVHRIDLVHGGIVPDAILIGPNQHDVILTNWYNGSYNREPFRFKSETHPQFYPKSLDAVIPEVDIFMAASVMLYAFPHMPDELGFYFNQLSLDALSGIIEKPDTLITEFDRRIYRLLGWRKEFVKLSWIDYDALRQELLK